MEVTRSLHIVRCLADGINPITGEIFPIDSPYQQAEVVRALFEAVAALKSTEQRLNREQSLPANAGTPWNTAEDEQLCQCFDNGATVKDLSRQHGRTHGAIQSRLDKLGKMIPMPTA